ncbi:MAG: sporulation protein YqfD [Bacilli bacterium]
MKNKIFWFFSSSIMISVTGKNVNNFVKRLIKNKINIIKLIPKSYKEVYLVIDYNDLEKIEAYKTIYDIKIVKYYGKLRFLKFIKKNIFIISFLVIGISIMYVLSNIIFDIEVIHSNSKIVNLIYSELDRHGIKKYAFVKSYNEIEKIKEEILNDNKDSLEWIEIIREGTKYTVRVEERIINGRDEDGKQYNVVAKKNAVIKKIVAESGEKVKNINTYVEKGEVVISSDITLPSGEKVSKGARGEVIGEVWYKIDIEYPYVYKEIKYTGKKKKVMVFNFINKRISLFDFNKYKSFNKNIKTIFVNNFIPISLVYEYQYETDIIDEIYTYEEAKEKAILEAKKKLLEKNDSIKEITDVKVLKEEDLSSKIYLSLFIVSNEDITEYSDIIADEYNNIEELS